MLGSFGVGKTSLVARFVQGMFAEKYHTTVGVKIDKKVLRVDDQEMMLMLWDMAGEEDNAPVKLSQVSNAAGYFMVVDGCRRKTLDVALSIQQRVQDEIGQRPCLLLANKADEAEKWEITDSDFDTLASNGWSVLKTSAKTGQNVEEAFAELSSRILRVQEDESLSEED